MPRATTVSPKARARAASSGVTPVTDIGTASAGLGTSLAQVTAATPARPASPGEAPKEERGAETVRRYAEIRLRNASPRKQRSLANIRQSLDHLVRVRSSDFSVVNVARTIEDLKLPGPKEQSIRNAEGADYRELIAVWAAAHGPRASEPAPSEDDLIAGIPDPRTAGMVRIVMAENRSLKRRLDMLHATFAQLAPLQTMPTTIPSGGQITATSATSTSAVGTVTDDEASTLRGFLANLAELECHLDPTTGALIHRTGLEMAGPGFGTLLHRLSGPPTKDS